MIRDPNPTQGGRSLDTAQVEGPMAVLRSENLAYSVVTRLKLMDDPEFQSWPVSAVKRLIGFAKSMLGLDAASRTAQRAAVPEPARQRTAVEILQSNLDVRRVGTSYAIDITYTSPDADKAAIVANAVAESYIDDQRKSMSRPPSRAATGWRPGFRSFAPSSTTRRASSNCSARGATFAASTNAGTWSRRTIHPPVNARAALRYGDPRQKRRRRAPARHGVRPPAGATPPGEITLAELESTTESYRKIYEAYQQAFTEAVQRQSFPVTNTRVIHRRNQTFVQKCAAHAAHPDFWRLHRLAFRRRRGRAEGKPGQYGENGAPDPHQDRLALPRRRPADRQADAGRQRGRRTAAGRRHRDARRTQGALFRRL